jgi:hypothetical protein
VSVYYVSLDFLCLDKEDTPGSSFVVDMQQQRQVSDIKYDARVLHVLLSVLDPQH